MKWSHFLGASLVAGVLLVWYGVPVTPILAGVTLIGLWKLVAQRSERRP